MYTPVTQQTTAEGYGLSIDTWQDYMVAGAQDNSSQEISNGTAWLYKLNAEQKWQKIAELSPSVRQKYLAFGQKVAMTQNTIAIYGKIYDDDGNASSKIFIFEKPATGEWKSAQENYTLTASSYILDIKFTDEALVVVEGGYPSGAIRLYKKTGGVFAMSQTLTTPLDAFGQQGGDLKIAIENNLIVVGLNGFRHADNTTGVIFVYQKTPGNPYSSTPVAQLTITRTLYDGVYLSGQISISNNTIYAIGGRTWPEGEMDVVLYVFEKPVSGWTDSKETLQIATGEKISNLTALMAADNSVFISAQESPYIIGLRKTGADWSSGLTFFKINSPQKHSLFGYQMEMTNGHLVIGAPFNYIFLYNSDPDAILDYYRPGSDWEHATTFNQKLTESSLSATRFFFGKSIAVFENYMAVGSISSLVNGNPAGLVYMYDTDEPEGTPPVVITPPQPHKYDNFGYATAMGDSLLFVSSIHEDTVQSNGQTLYYNSGKVHVFRLRGTTWRYHSAIVAPVVKREGWFGQAIAYSNGYVAISEYYEGTSESDGLVHIYKANSSGKFLYLATLRPEEDIRGDFFGRSITMTENMIVIAAGNFETDYRYRSKAFVFVKHGEWKNATEDARLLPTTKNQFDLFGYSVAADGDYIVVGSPGYPGVGTSSPVKYRGAAYVFKKPTEGWKGTINETAQLLPSDPADYKMFGFSVGIDNKDIFVGAPYGMLYYNYTDFLTNNDNTIQNGKVYHYLRTGTEWTSSAQELRQIESFEPHPLDGYGSALLITGRSLYASALFANTDKGYQSGSVQTLMQLPAIKPVDTLCVKGSPVALKGYPRKGEWSGTGIQPAKGVLNPAIPGAGTHTYSYSVYGCVTSAEVQIVDFNFNILKESPAEQMKCKVNSIEVTLDTDTEAQRYIWYYRPEGSAVDSKYDSLKRTLIVKNPGTYTGKIRHKHCPAYTKGFRVIDEKEVDIEFKPLPIICSDQEIDIEVNPAGGVWSATAPIQNNRLQASQLSDGKKNFDYTFTTPLGCVFVKALPVEVDKLVAPELVQEGDKVCVSKTARLELRGVDSRTSVEWFGETGGITTRAGTANELIVSAPMNYFAKIFKHSCQLQTEPVSITALLDSLSVPNVFTPNGDTYNEFFQVSGEDLNDFQLLIINRSGKPVFTSTDPAFQWNGENLPSGIYFWRVTYTNCALDRKEQRGWVQLIR